MNRFNTPTIDDPTTKTKNIPINHGETEGPSALRSPAFPSGTLPRFVILPSNLEVRFRRFRGSAYVKVGEKNQGKAY
jgi:hypothetical protein